jgi:hypothetical protein
MRGDQWDDYRYEAAAAAMGIDTTQHFLPLALRETGPLTLTPIDLEDFDRPTLAEAEGA